MQVGMHLIFFSGLGWSYPCDAFSLGCILVEFYTGVALFQTHDNLDHLAMMEAVMGRMPERFGRQGARSKPEYFKEGPRLDWPKPKASRQSKKDVRACRSLAVSVHMYLPLIIHVLTSVAGNHRPHGPHQQTLPGSRAQAADLRPNATDHRSGSVESPLLSAERPRRDVIRWPVRYLCFVVVLSLSVCFQALLVC